MNQEQKIGIPTMQMFSLDKNEMLVLNVVREERSILWGAGL